MQPRRLVAPEGRGQRRVYGRSERPWVDVPLGGGWVPGQVLVRIRDADGTWWAKVAYVDPSGYQPVVEALPEDVLRTRP